MTWFFIEARFDGRPLLIEKAFASEQDATQAAMQDGRMGEFRIISFPTRDKVRVRQLWKMQQIYH
jgi:hypothetical protein